MSRPLRLAALAGVLTALGCATPYEPLTPLGSEIRVETLDPDEQALWKKSRELQYEIEKAGLLFEDPKLATYVGQVLERVRPPELSQSGLTPRVEIISNVNIHGYSFANGVIYIHTALLSRMTDETQLAAVLSRELAHVVNRHALRAHRDKKLHADTLAWVGVGSAVAGSMVDGAGAVNMLVQAASVTSAAGFSHHLETSADAKGLEILAAGGYDVSETPGLYEMTLAYLAEVHGQGVFGWVPFAPPPQVAARIQGYEQLIATTWSDQKGVRAPLADAADFRRRMHEATLRQCDLEMAAGLFVSAVGCSELATESGPKDPRAWMHLGKALNGRRTKPLPGQATPSIKKVREAYGRALELDRRNPEAIRELGMSHYRKTGSTRSAEDREQALRYFRRYLGVASGAGDVEYVRGYVRELEAEGN